MSGPSRGGARMPVGYVRDRTALYRDKWDALHPNANAASVAAVDRIGRAIGATDTTGLLADAANGQSDGVAVPMPGSNASVHRIMDAEQEINRQLQAARTDLAALSRLQTANAEDLFGMNKGQQSLVDEKRGALRDTIRRIHGLIVALPEHADDDSAPVADRIKRAKATALSEIATELNRQEIRDLQARTHRKVPGMDQSSMDVIFNQLSEPSPAYTQQQMQQLTDIQHEYEQRDEAIAELVKEVTELQEVMRDLSVLVVEQGSMVDRIDQNVHAVALHLERGVEHIRRAHESTKNSTMATCILVLLVAVALVFVIMLLVKVRV